MSSETQKYQKSDETLLTLGELSRGIAHDLKNFLTAIQGNAELAMRHTQNASSERAMNMVIRASQSARDLCNQVLTYSQEKVLPSTVFDLRELLEEAKMISEPSLNEETTIGIDPGNEALPIEASRSQVLQILLNLISNAIHAIGERPGKILVRVKRDDNVCRIIVEDNGPGIAPEHHEHLFQAGYTTKIYGLATGLGLALVKRISETYGGTVVLHSPCEGGCSFTVTLPLSDKPVEGLDISTSNAPKPKVKRSVLLVDDEEFMRSLGIDILQSLGYRVTVSDSGKSALELVEKNPDYFDIILSDSRMPELTGEELAVAVQKIRPGIPFVLVTAFAVTDDKTKLMTQGISGVVAKPFLIEDLRKALEAALAAK